MLVATVFTGCVVLPVIEMCFFMEPVVTAPIEGGPPLVAIFVTFSYSSFMALTGFRFTDACCCYSPRFLTKST